MLLSPYQIMFIKFASTTINYDKMEKQLTKFLFFEDSPA